MSKRIYIIGICGTFMGGLARLARELDIEVSGSDANTYPPMSTQLESMDIKLHEGYAASNVDVNADMIIIGNTISRGNPELEYVLDKGLAYTSGAQWLHDNVLQGKWVLGVAGTHGKTTTSSLLAWLLESNGMQPGFLIGGVPENFGISSKIGESPFFVIEADEYDTSFSDKRSKFIHYRPRTLVLNNLEFDHADIFDDLAAIQTQFHHLIKTIPESGLIIHNETSVALDDTLALGCWSETEGFAGQNSTWRCEKMTADASHFYIYYADKKFEARWSLIGDHNMHNALAAIAAAHHVGVTIEHSIESLASFKSVKRRLELIYQDSANTIGKVSVYDDFAHHPTAITETVNALRNNVGDERIIAILEPRSNTMKRGVHKDLLSDSLQSADIVMVYADNQVKWDISELQTDSSTNIVLTFDDAQKLLENLLEILQANDHVLIMSNGSFNGLHQNLITALKSG